MDRADPAGEESGKATRALILVTVGGTRLGVPLASVAEVTRLPPVTRVPGLPHWVRGLVNLRGRLVAVLDVANLLGLSAAPTASGSQRVLVLSGDGLTAGIGVDFVGGVAEVSAAGVEALPAGLSSQAAAFLAGTAVVAGTPVALLDVPAVLQARNTLPSARSRSAS
ncbi:MAG: chemotaxis protein CheW [Frankiaceae bacterium]